MQAHTHLTPPCWKPCSHVCIYTGLRKLQSANVQAGCVPSTGTPDAILRYAVVGGGLAGVATAWELLQQTRKHNGASPQVEVALYDAHGIACGGSGAAAGLLHPYSPRGKLLWKGAEAMQAAQDLVQLAQAAAPSVQGPVPSSSLSLGLAPFPGGRLEAGQPGLTGMKTASSWQPLFVWQNGLVRPAADRKQVGHILDAARKMQQQQQQQQHSNSSVQPKSDVAMQEQSQPLTLQGGLDWCPVHVVSGPQLQQLVPGLRVPTLKHTHQLSLLSSPAHSSPASALSSQPPSPSQGYQAWTDKQNSSLDRSNSDQGNDVIGDDRNGSEVQQGTQASYSTRASTSDPARSNSYSVRQGIDQAPQAASDSLLDASSVAGFYVPNGLVINVPQYLQQLWLACQQEAAARGNGSSAVLHQEQIHSVAELQQEHGPFDAVVVAAGAAVGTLADAPLNGLPLKLCQGYTLVMEPGADGEPFPDAPSLLGQPYVAAQGQSLIIGATQQYGMSPEASLAMGSPDQRVAYRAPAAAPANLTSSTNATSHAGVDIEAASTSATSPFARRAKVSTSQSSFSRSWLPGLQEHGHKTAAAAGSVAVAAQELLEGAAQLWPALKSWQIKEVRSGVRAVPFCSASGSVPLLGRLESELTPHASTGLNDDAPYTTHRALKSHLNWKDLSKRARKQEQDIKSKRKSVWLFVGLGARGLLYHALFARQLAAGVVTGNEHLLEQETRAWKGTGKS